MSSWGPRLSLKTALVAVFCLVAVAIASGAVVAGVLESSRVASAKAAASPTAVQRPPSVATPQATPAKATSTPTPTMTRTPTAASVVADVPQQVVTTETPRSARQPQPAPAPLPTKTCPAGTVTSTLTSVDYKETSRYGYPEVLVTGRGTITNGTTAAVQIMQTDVPDLEGLDERGQIEAIQTTGTYDWAPPPGVPSGGVIDLQPGQTLAFTVVEDTYRPSSTVKYWYSSTESGSVLMYFTDFRNANCHVFGMPERSGNSIANTFVPKS